MPLQVIQHKDMVGAEIQLHGWLAVDEDELAQLLGKFLVQGSIGPSVALERPSIKNPVQAFLDQPKNQEFNPKLFKAMLLVQKL